jgi:penicillin-binding protein 1C
VLPNAPGLIYPGKNHQRLLEKRNRLLKTLADKKLIDASTYLLALAEPLPEKPLPLPQLAPHLLTRLIKEHGQGQTIRTTLDAALQNKATQLLQIHSQLLQENKIFNGAILITSVKTGEVIAYVGNTRQDDAEHGNEVDCIVAPRSTGSILKPFLYAKCLEDGIITPAMLVPDIPTQFGSFAPKNFSMSYDGAVPANKALTRSLNIPMVLLLNEYGLEKFHRGLRNLGFSTLSKSARHYGLSLILGGAEAKLWDLNSAYLHMAQELRNENETALSFCSPQHGIPQLVQASAVDEKINKACIYKTFEAMVEVNRPDEEGNWRVFASAQKIAWKTGTSFGFRDAWAIGITPDYVVSVWIGNAGGEGRPGLTGIKAAAPLLFDLFAQLPKSTRWFAMPTDEMCYTAVCRESGHRASELCEKPDSVWLPKTCLNTAVCPYHQRVHLTKNGKQRVESDCESVYNMQHLTWFVLPPLIEKFYKSNHPSYKVLPDFKPECLARTSDKALAISYPRPSSRIYVPVEMDGTVGRTVFEASHRNAHTKVFWNLDDTFIGQTQEIHQLALNPTPGKHKLMLTDENGISVAVKFEVIENEHAAQ